MFISPPNNFNQTEMWNSESPMMPMPKFGMHDDTRQKPTPGSSTATPGASTPGTSTGTQEYAIAPGSPVVNNPLYTQGWLKGQIGKYIRVAFLLGTNTFQDRGGTLQEVGISFIVLKETSTNNLIMCDIYSIKFVTVFANQTIKCQD